MSSRIELGVKHQRCKPRCAEKGNLKSSEMASLTEIRGSYGVRNTLNLFGKMLSRSVFLLIGCRPKPSAGDFFFWHAGAATFTVPCLACLSNRTNNRTLCNPTDGPSLATWLLSDCHNSHLEHHDSRMHTGPLHNMFKPAVVRRSACDQCRARRVQCLRAQNSTAPCARCAHVGARCATSAGVVPIVERRLHMVFFLRVQYPAVEYRGCLGHG